MTSKINIVALLDGMGSSNQVEDAAIWAAKRLDAPLQLLHALENPTGSTATDYSGNLEPDSREHLLEQLAALDEQRNKLALEHGKQLLAHAKARALEAGVANIQLTQRHDSLVDAVLANEPDTRLLVMGRAGEAHLNETNVVGSHLETLVRSVHRPVWVSVGEFVPPQNFMVAFDGSTTSRNALETVLRSDLLKGLTCHVVAIDGDETSLNDAVAMAATAGFSAKGELLSGNVVDGLTGYQRDNQIDLIVMGAYGHSPIRRWLLGSNTTKMIAASAVPLLLLR